MKKAQLECKCVFVLTKGVFRCRKCKLTMGAYLWEVKKQFKKKKPVARPKPIALTKPLKK